MSPFARIEIKIEAKKLPGFYIRRNSAVSIGRERAGVASRFSATPADGAHSGWIKEKR
jgi:hypothetical protein